MAYRRAGLGLGAIARVLEAPESRLARTLEKRLDALSQEIQALCIPKNEIEMIRAYAAGP